MKHEPGQDEAQPARENVLLFLGQLGTETQRFSISPPLLVEVQFGPDDYLAADIPELGLHGHGHGLAELLDVLGELLALQWEGIAEAPDTA
ncbi:MAG: hypothetical protein ABI743_11380, partial [bacterium]